MHAQKMEDECRAAASVKRGLEAEGYVVEVTVPGRETLDWAGGVPFDAIVVLDLPIPDADGLTECRELGSYGARTPILTLRAREGVDGRAAGLYAGAEDYRVERLALNELLVQLRALARRTADRPRTGVLQIVLAASRARRHGPGAPGEATGTAVR